MDGVNLDLAQSLVIAIVPVLTPIVISLLKRFVEQIPTQFLPILAPVIGMVITGIAEGFGIDSAATGAVLGSAGVGIREIVNQNITKTKV
jgi:hypothetical protein